MTLKFYLIINLCYRASFVEPSVNYYSVILCNSAKIHFSFKRVAVRKQNGREPSSKKETGKLGAWNLCSRLCSYSVSEF